jgi:diguanylate cyclase (GGDEF)-like protein
MSYNSFISLKIFLKLPILLEGKLMITINGLLKRCIEMSNNGTEIQTNVLEENRYRLRWIASVGALVNTGVTIASLLDSYYGPQFIQCEIYIRLLWIALSGLFLIGSSKKNLHFHKAIFSKFMTITITASLAFSALVSFMPFADHSYLIVFYANLLLIGTLIYLSDVETAIVILPSLLIIGVLYILYPESIVHQQSNLINVVSITFFAAVMAHMNYNSKKKHCEAMKIIHSQHEELHRLSSLDELTGLANRRSINETLERLIKESDERKCLFAVLMIDIDYFKHYNDCYGHLQGDDCLVKVANALETITDAEHGFIGRFGGEEFLVFLPFQDETKVNQFAESICSAISSLNMTHNSSPFGIITVSVGVCVDSSRTDTNKIDLIERADQALYRAKFEGRNRVIVSK